MCQLVVRDLRGFRDLRVCWVFWETLRNFWVFWHFTDFSFSDFWETFKNSHLKNYWLLKHIIIKKHLIIAKWIEIHIHPWLSWYVWIGSDPFWLFVEYMLKILAHTLVDRSSLGWKNISRNNSTSLHIDCNTKYQSYQLCYRFGSLGLWRSLKISFK